MTQAESAGRADRDSWFRIGHLLNDVRKNVRDEQPSPPRDSDEPRPQRFPMPFRTLAPSLHGRDGAR